MSTRLGAHHRRSQNCTVRTTTMVTLTSMSSSCHLRSFLPVTIRDAVTRSYSFFPCRTALLPWAHNDDLPKHSSQLTSKGTLTTVMRVLPWPFSFESLIHAAVVALVALLHSSMLVLLVELHQLFRGNATRCLHQQVCCHGIISIVLRGSLPAQRSRASRHL